MRVAVTIDDTTIEIEDEQVGYSHDVAAAMITTATGEAITAYEALLIGCRRVGLQRHLRRALPQPERVEPRCDRQHLHDRLDRIRQPVRR